MNKKKWLMVITLFIASVLAVRMTASPKVYMGMVVAMIGAGLIGLWTDPKTGSLFGAAIPAVGLLLRHYWPQLPAFSGKRAAEKMAAYEAANASYQSFIHSYFWLFILLGALLGYGMGKAAQALDHKEKKSSPHRLAQMAVFTALSVLINSLRIGALSFSGFPIIFSGYLLGPWEGFLVGAASDIVSFIVRPSSMGYNPFFTLTSALTGLIPVLVTEKWLKDDFPDYHFWKVLVGIYVGQFITSVFMVSWMLGLLSGKEVGMAKLAKTAIDQAIKGPVYSFLLLSIMTPLTKALHFDRNKGNKRAGQGA